MNPEGIETFNESKQEDEDEFAAGKIDRRKRRSSILTFQSAFLNMSTNTIPDIDDVNDHDEKQEMNAIPTKDKENSTNLENEHQKKPKDQINRTNFQLGQKLRSFRQIVFLILTKPQSSLFSALFFVILIIMIALSNLLMMVQTTKRFCFTPTTCSYCTDLAFDNNTNYCACPPEPMPSLMRLQDYMIMFFTVEWFLRVICFVPKANPSNSSSIQSYRKGITDYFKQWISFLCRPSMIIDALAIFPYYLERFGEFKGLLALRLLRLFRVFQLLRLGKYNVTFTTLSNVMTKSFLGLNILCIALIFGAAFFGSMIYWFEKGEWRYTTYTDPPSFLYMRLSADGVTEEPSPFTSIPAAFWWFVVTATTVGYGDVYPTSSGGKVIATFAMLTGLLVVAFPVSIFSDLWHQELNKSRGSRKGLTSAFGFEGPRKRRGSSYISNIRRRTSLSILRRGSSRFKSLRRSSSVANTAASTLQKTNSEKEVLSVSKIKYSENNTDDSVIVDNNDDNPISKSSSRVLLKQSDLDSLNCHLALIDESQTKIRKILSNCN